MVAAGTRRRSQFGMLNAQSVSSHVPLQSLDELLEPGVLIAALLDCKHLAY